MVSNPTEKEIVFEADDWQPDPYYPPFNNPHEAWTPRNDWQGPYGPGDPLYDIKDIIPANSHPDGWKPVQPLDWGTGNAGSPHEGNGGLFGDVYRGRRRRRLVTMERLLKTIKASMHRSGA